MIKLEAKVVKQPSGDSETVYPPTIKRETTFVHQKRPICVELAVSGLVIGLKGTQQYYSVPYDKLFVDAQQGSVSLAARSGAVTQKTAAALINRDLAKVLHNTLVALLPIEAMWAVNLRVDIRTALAKVPE